MSAYIIDFYGNNEFVNDYYYYYGDSPERALLYARQELYLNGYDADYYVIYTLDNKYNEEGSM